MRYKEESYMKDGIRPVLSIPGKNIELHSTCFICRINRETNELESVQDGDYNMVEKYFINC